MKKKQEESLISRLSRSTEIGSTPRTYYKVSSWSISSKNGKMKRIKRNMFVEVIVTDHKAGVCQITPVAGMGSMGVKSSNLLVK